MSDHWNALGQRNFMPETALSRSPRSFVGFDSSYYRLVAGVNGPDGRLDAGVDCAYGRPTALFNSSQDRPIRGRAASRQKHRKRHARQRGS